MVIDARAVQAALEKLKSDPEPEAHMMRMANGFAPAYNVQTAVDAEHALIVAQKVTEEATDNRMLLSMAEAAKQGVGNPDSLNVVADAGYWNGEQAEACEARGILPHVPANRAANNQGNGHLFDCSKFHYDEKTDTSRCPANQTLTRKQLQRHKTRRLRGRGRGVRCMHHEIALHQCAATIRTPSPSRWGFRAHAAARDAGENATATIDSRASVRLA